MTDLPPLDDLPRQDPQTSDEELGRALGGYIGVAADRSTDVLALELLGILVVLLGILATLLLKL